MSEETANACGVCKKETSEETCGARIAAIVVSALLSLHLQPTKQHSRQRISSQ